MSCLDATFTLTPQTPDYSDFSLKNYAYLNCCGADFRPFSPFDFSSLYASNRFFFDSSFAGDPNLNYADPGNRKNTPFLSSQIELFGYAKANKQLALIFGFDTASQARVLVYSDAGLLKDQELLYGDNQFLVEIESLDLPFALYFIHAGGDWFFRGLSGYVV